MARLGRAQPAPPPFRRRGAWPTVSVAEGLDLTVIQRSGTTGSLTLSGTHDGATSVQVKIINAVGGATVVDWTTVDAAPGSTTWAGTLTGIPQGGWYVRQVRPGNATANVTTGSIRFGVGVLLPPMGQSIHVQWFTVGTDVSPHAMLVQYSGGTWSARGSTGNGANAFGNAICNALGGTVPVALLPLAVGATALNSAGGGSGYWMDTAGGSPYALALAAINAVGGKVEAIPWDQGQQDAFSNAVSESTYASDLATFIARWRTALSQSSLPFIIAPLGRYTNPGPTDASWQGIRNAQYTVGNQANNGLAAPMADLALSDNVHYTAADYIKHGQRVAQATLFMMGLASFERGPTWVSAQQTGLNTVLATLLHGGGTDLSPATGITGVQLLSAGTPVTLTSVARASATTVLFTAAAALSGPLVIRNLHGVNPTVSGVLVDNSSLALPADGIGSLVVAEAATGASSSIVAVSNTGAGVAREAAAGGASSTVSVSNAGAGVARETTAGGSSSTVAVSNTGAGVAREAAAGGASSTVSVSNVGAGIARETAAGGAQSSVSVTSAGGGAAQEDGTATGGSSSTVSVANAGAGVARETAAGGSSSTIGVSNVGAGLALEIVVGGTGTSVAVTSVGGGVANTGSGNDFAGGSSSSVAVSSVGAGLVLEIAVGGSSSIVAVRSAGFGFQPQDEAPPLDIFARMSTMVLKTFGRPSYLNGSTTPVKINIEHNVQLAGMGSEQAAYRGDYVANRDIATIETGLNPQIGDRFVQDGIQYRLEMLVKDNGVNRRFVISRVRT